jgi:hypothetical protein
MFRADVISIETKTPKMNIGVFIFLALALMSVELCYQATVPESAVPQLNYPAET